MAKTKIIQDYKRFLSDGSWRSFFAVWSLRNFAFGLIAVFSPIYFYANGYGLGFIFIFLAVQAFFNGLMRMPYAYILSKRRNIKIPFAVSLLLMSLVYAGYALFIDDKRALIFIAAFDGILQCMLWTSYHYIFSAEQHHKRVGSQIGVMYDGSYVSVALAILLGGFIGQRYGLIYNFLIAAVVICFASLLILRTKIVWPHKSHNFKRHKVNFKNLWKDGLAGTANIIDANIVAVIWPLLFVVFGLLNYFQVGLVIAVGLLSTILINLVFGKFADDIDDAKKQLDIGIMATIFIYLIRITSIASSFGAIFINILGQIFRGAVDVSFGVLFYRKLKRADSKIRYLAEYETITGYGLALFFATLWLIHSLGGSDKITMISAFLIAASVLPLARLIRTNK